MILGVGAGAEAGLDAETDVDAEADAEGDRGAEEEVRRPTIGNVVETLSKHNYYACYYVQGDPSPGGPGA